MCCVSALNQLDEWFYKLWGEKQRTFILLKEVLSNVCQINLKKGYCWHTLSLLNRFGSIRVQLNPITVKSVTLQLVFWLQIICRVTLIIQTIYNSATTFNARFKKSTTTKKNPNIFHCQSSHTPRFRPSHPWQVAGTLQMTVCQIITLVSVTKDSTMYNAAEKRGNLSESKTRSVVFSSSRPGVDTFIAPTSPHSPDQVNQSS